MRERRPSVEQARPSPDPAGPGRAALLVVAATLVVGPVGAVGLAGALDGVRVAGVPLGVLAGELLAPAAVAAVVAGYAIARNALERRRGPDAPIPGRPRREEA